MVAHQQKRRVKPVEFLAGVKGMLSHSAALFNIQIFHAEQLLCWCVHAFPFLFQLAE